MAPKVLISDKLSDAAVQIFKDRGIDVDFQPDLGKDKDKLAAVIGDYDGLAIRSATKVTEKILANATNLKVIARAGIGTDNIDKDAASKKGVIVMNTPLRQHDHHCRTRDCDDVRRCPSNPRGIGLHPCRQMGKVQIHGG